MISAPLNDEDLLALLNGEESTPPPRSSVPALVKQLKQADQDHEFYPTTDEIITALARDIGLKDKEGRCHDREYNSVLDIGAGNGKVLLALRHRCGIDQLHAIEKSSILCHELDPDILVVGTDFEAQSLLSKAVDVIFCNPPYSQFELWAEKIIRQSASKVIYLVIPQRWENSIRIKDALRFRKVEARKIGAFDFEDAEDRTARAKVHLLKITLVEKSYGNRHDREQSDPFTLFFEEQFADLINKFKESNKKLVTCPSCGRTGKMNEPDEDGNQKCGACYDTYEPSKGGRTRPFHGLVVGPNYPDALVSLYRGEMDHINNNYQLVSQLDTDLLREFEISPPKIMAMLKTRLTGLRSEYWQELFDHLKAITDRLTSGSRKSLLGTLQRHVSVDFTTDNICAILVWVLKNANRYMESQLIDTYELMVDKCNVQMYKSNQRTWQDNGWRYGKPEINNTHYALDYRIVTHRIGGITSSYSSSNGLDERANDFLGDLMTVARNLGFIGADWQRKRLNRWNRDDKWTSGTRREFFFNKKGKPELLFDVRAFMNGNLHLRLNQDFILALNVEHGRLKGWLRTPKEAAEELKDPKAVQYFRSNLQLATSNPSLMLTDAKEAA